MTIKTDNKPRNILYWYDLTPKEQKKFDYLDSQTRRDGATFFRYRGQAYDLNEFMRCDGWDGWEKWDGYAGDSFFSGVLIKYVNDFEQVIAATFFS